MHTEIRTPSEKERRIIPARSPKQAAEALRQLRALHLEYIRRKREAMERVKLR